MLENIELFLPAIFLGYILGSIPFGLLLTKMAGLGDVRNIGSGNIGATNVLRTGNKALAAGTLAFDMFKGTLPVLIANILWGYEASLIAGLSAFVGHLFPVWLKFKGGKGVATYIGVLLGIYWPLSLVFAVVWLSIAYLTKYSSLSALIACLVVPVVLAVQSSWMACIVVSIMSLLVYIRHHANISRLIKGEEPRIGASKS